MLPPPADKVLIVQLAKPARNRPKSVAFRLKRSTRVNPHAVGYCLAWEQDDLLTSRYASRHCNLGRVSVCHGHGALFGPPVRHSENRPPLTLAERHQ
jgi:hypothetical protein